MTDPVALRERARELREYGEHSRDPRIIRETREDAAEVELWADEVEAASADEHSDPEEDLRQVEELWRITRH